MFVLGVTKLAAAQTPLAPPTGGAAPRVPSVTVAPTTARLLEPGRTGVLVPPGLPTAVRDPGTVIAPPALTGDSPREVRVGGASLPGAAGLADDPAARRDPGDDDVSMAEETSPLLLAATTAQAPSLRSCRVEIAAQRRPGARGVRLGALLLRFTVQRSGRVGGPEVVALEPTDPDVLICVRDRLLRLRYDPAPPADVRVEYQLTAR